MRLQPVQIAPGLWQTPDYQPQKAAVHALIVGISSYTRLSQGKDIGIQQLAVSALTAYRFFKWLGTYYRHSGTDVPIRARLLLSPTAKELELFAADGLAISVGDQVANTARDPNLWNFRNAVKDWFTDAAAVRENVADSRTVFFFSGHGLEIDRDKQLLLPSDYRYTDADRMDMLSTENIKGGMARLAIAKQFYFVDACRSDVASMWDLADASGLVAVPESKLMNKALVASVMRASVAEAVTYQPSVATTVDSLSFFGKALMDALELNPGADSLFKPMVVPEFPGPAICWYPLYSYVNRAVKATIAKFPTLGMPITGPISIGETIEDPLLVSLAQVEPPAPQAAHGPGEGGGGPVPVPGDEPGGNGGAAPDDPIREGLVAFRVQADLFAEPVEAIAQGPTDTNPVLQKMWSKNDSPQSSPTAGDYGSAPVFALIAGARKAVWTADGWMSAQSEQPFTVVQVDRSADASLVRVHVEMSDRGWNWIELCDRSAPSPNSQQEIGVTYAFLIPETDFESGPIIVAFDVAAGTVTGFAGISDVQATLSPLNAGPLRVAARLFDLYRLGTASRALSEITQDPTLSPAETASASTFPFNAQDLAAATSALQGKTDSPIAATVAALVLLRARRFAERTPATQWLKNLSDWYPYSDASLFAYQALVDEGLPIDTETALSHFVRIAQCGTPFTGEGFGYLLRMFDTYFKPDARGRSPLLSPEMKSKLPEGWQAFHKRIVDVQGAYRGSGLFTTFVARPSKISKIQDVIL